ncbi:MAG: hypothetical protein K9H61_12860 [Bacteroidia bacterium]|nr:hypothetical protein [Bacteroidia bacterium]MCF8427295.1 hypothetical protein [Bacteroidia bacterium]MCF8447873.1 hypothetical protein [Bacteroidia bacterium]
MKSLSLTFLSFLLVINVFAQVETCKNIFGITPYFSNISNAQKLPFEPALIDNNYYVNGKYEKPLDVNYVGFYVNLESYQRFKNNFYSIGSVEFGKDKYIGTLNYSNSNSKDSPIDSFAKEDINGLTIGMSLGIAKAYFVTKSKKLMLMPKVEFYSKGLIKERDIITSGNPYKFSETNTTLYQGLRLGLNVNYFFSKHFGVGLSFNQVFKLETTTYSKVSLTREQKETGVVLNLNQLPQVRFLYTFNFRKDK